MQYKVFTNSFIRKEKLDSEELIRLYFNDSRISQTEDTFEFESDDYKEAQSKFESLQIKPEYDCFNRGYRYVIVILTDECDVLDTDVIGF